MCELLGEPISHKKMEWADNLMVFFGILLNGKYFLLGVPT